MAIGLVGRKTGMTRIFQETGESIPVTVIEVEPNRITQVKSPDSDGYSAIQVTTGEKKPSRINKPEAGHFAKAAVTPGRGLWEFRLSAEEAGDYEQGVELKADLFEAGQHVDVVGVSKGKGFQGGIKRWNFTGKEMTHGNSLAHRTPGSIGQAQDPGKVFKGKKMPGHMGDKRTTEQNLEVVRVDAERNIILVKGAVPGANGRDLVIQPTVKAKG